VSTLFAALAAPLGLILGSFATMAAHRIPLRASLNGRSKCPSCEHTITAVENIPVLSYLIQRGRCRHCGDGISVRYPLIEILTATLFALAALRFGPTLRAAVYAAFFWVLVMLSVIDLEHHLLPDRIVFPALAVGALLLLADAVTEGAFGRMSAVVAASAAAVGALLWVLLPRRGPALESENRHASWLVGLGFVLAWMGLVGFGIAGGAQRSVSGALVGAAVFGGFFFAVALLVPQGMGGGDVNHVNVGVGQQRLIGAVGTGGGRVALGEGLGRARRPAADGRQLTGARRRQRLGQFARDHARSERAPTQCSSWFGPLGGGISHRR